MNPIRRIPILALASASLLLALPATANASYGNKATISAEEVTEAQRAWGNGIVAIGQAYTQDGFDAARQKAEQHIRDHYGYEMGEVLFKPTLASEDQFRTTFDEALSYFVGSDPNHPEDKGFAIRPWTQVRWENIGTRIENGMAVAMGNYYFTPAGGGEEVKVEYSFGYVRDANGTLRIVLHDSSLPYAPSS